MYLEQFFVEGLGHASYLIASDTTKEAMVVDPRRDVLAYVEAANRRGLDIRYVLETHLHNDFVSGGRQLASCQGAELVASAEAELGFDYRGVRDGDELRLGELIIRVLRTPGHTPEHVSYAVIDTERDDEPFLVFSGGDLLVGAVGRPDLLGKELGAALAPQLYDSLHGKLLPLGDHVIVLPTHGSGSLCGRGISGTRLSTIGYERRANPMLKIAGKDEFVARVLSGDPAIPAYYARMRPTNQGGPEPFRAPEPRPLPAHEVQHLAGHGALVLDTRQNVAFGGGHIPGALNVPLGPMLSTWVGWLVSPETPLILVLDRDEDWSAVTTALLRIGYERFVGYLQLGMSSWVEHGLPIERVEQLSVQELQRRLDERPEVQVLDVRLVGEWQGGHIERATHVMLGDLPAALDRLDLDRERPIAAVCGSGYRSSIATSLLEQRGFKQVWNTLGGITAWKESGLPTVQDNEPSGGNANGQPGQYPPVRDEGQHLVRRVAVSR